LNEEDDFMPSDLLDDDISKIDLENFDNMYD